MCVLLAHLPVPVSCMLNLYAGVCACVIFEINVIREFFGILCGVGNLFVSVWFYLFPAGLELTGGTNYGKWPNYHGSENLICLHNACLTFAASLQLFCDDCKSMQKYLNSR